MSILNSQGFLDVRNVVTGKDGQLFLTTSKGTEIFLAEVDSFQAKLNVKNTDYQPIGSPVSMAVPSGFSVNLTFSEAVVRDDVLMDEIISDLTSGKMPNFDFQGKISRQNDGREQRQVYRNCVPDGDIDLMNITPGDIIKRQWNFRVNALPEMLASFTNEPKKD